MESSLKGLSFALLLTSPYVLRFRDWRRPFAVICYFAFFVTLEMIASNYFLPKDAFGSAFSWLCLGLTVPVLIAAFVVRRLENRQDEIPDR